MGGSTPLNANIVPTGMVPEEYISVSQALRQYSAIKICSISVVNRRIKLINSKGKNKIFFLSSLISLSIAYKVVDFPEPVGPDISIIP